jgi:hypothetical protein
MPSWVQGALTRAPSAAHVTGGPPVVLLELDALEVDVAVEVALELDVELVAIPLLALDAEVDAEVDPDVVTLVDVLPEAPPEPVPPAWPTPALPPQAERRTIERKKIRMPMSLPRMWCARRSFVRANDQRPQVTV